MRKQYGLQYDGDDRREAVWARVLRARYDELANAPVPDRFRELLERLEDADSHER